MPNLIDNQKPRILRTPFGAPRHRPRHTVSNTAASATVHAELAGIDLDEWQREFLNCTLNVDVDGRYTAREAGLLAPRPAGKTEAILVREIVGLVSLGENIIHTSSLKNVAVNDMQRLLRHLDSSPALRAMIKRVSRTNGDEYIETTAGTRIKYVARTPHSGRPLSADLLVVDDATDCSREFMAAALPMLLSSQNPQILFVGTAVNKRTHPRGDVFTHLRNRALRADPSILWQEHSAPDDRDEDGNLLVDVADPAVAAAANPGQRRVQPGVFDQLRRVLQPDVYLAECLGIGDWPDLDEHGLSK